MDRPRKMKKIQFTNSINTGVALNEMKCPVIGQWRNALYTPARRVCLGVLATENVVIRKICELDYRFHISTGSLLLS